MDSKGCGGVSNREAPVYRAEMEPSALVQDPRLRLELNALVSSIASIDQAHRERVDALHKRLSEQTSFDDQWIHRSMGELERHWREGRRPYFEALCQVLATEIKGDVRYLMPVSEGHARLAQTLLAPGKAP